MLGKRVSLAGLASAVGMLLVPLSLSWQGCEKQGKGERAELVGASTARSQEGARPEAAAPAEKPAHETTAASRGHEQQRPSGESRAVVITDADFAETTGKGVVLVDLWSEQCPPCRMQGPIVDKIAMKFAGRATVGKLDVGANANSPEKLGLMYIPTLIIFRDGRELKRFVGLQSETVLSAALEEALGRE